MTETICDEPLCAGEARLRMSVRVGETDSSVALCYLHAVERGIMSEIPAEPEQEPEA